VACFLLEPFAEGAFLAEWVAQFVLLESFAYIAGEGSFQDFGQALVGDVPEGDLPAVV
jgi:hypothetical protein